MCGIAGWIGRMRDPQRRAEQMAGLLRHRGPDEHGVRLWPQAGLVHTRLSIIDLTPTGAQPMCNEDGRVWTAFNGEIYNHAEVRRWLESRGHVFRGRSDTEVIPHLWEEEGPELAKRLRGMFAIAVYDDQQKSLFLLRDRFGIKPLYYATAPDFLAFGSEIPALTSLPDVDLRPDPQAIHDFAALLCVPAPLTFYRGVRALEPGCWLEATVANGSFSFHERRYHAWTIAPDFSWTAEKAAVRAEELILQAVGRQLESDVPLGSLLSGGIDSSLVSAAAQRSLTTPLRTFNVEFADEAYDETWAAVAVAEHIGSRHQTLPLPNATGTWDSITRLLLHAGQPFADTSLFAVNAVCREMRKHVTVALSGDGGDEGFGGYRHYAVIGQACRWGSLPGVIQNPALVAARGLARLGRTGAHLPRRLTRLAKADDTDLAQSMLCWLDDQEHAQLIRERGLLPVRRHYERSWEHHLPRRASRLERVSAHCTEVSTRLVLANDFLCKVDLASMRESLEIRVPMLDEDLFDFALTLPHAIKVRRAATKAVSRDLARRWLPEAVASKKKRGFGVPVDRWTDDAFRAELSRTLLGSDGPLSDVFSPEAYRPIVEAFVRGRPLHGVSRQALYQRTIMLLSVHLTLAAQRPSPVMA